MSEVKALHPIGKTQWAKWVPEQQIAFNETRASGVPFADAVKYVNELELVEVNIAPQAKEKSGLLRALEETIEGLTLLGQEQDAEGVTPPAADEVVAGPSPTASAPKKPRAPRKKKA